MLDINFQNFNPRNLKLSLSKFSDIKNGFFDKEKIILLIKGVCLVAIFYFVFVASPFGFSAGSIVEIKQGLSTQEVAETLKEKKIIKSKILFESLVRIFRGDRGVMSGDYFLEKRANLFSITYRMTKGIFGLTPVKVTVHEGLTVREMADIFDEKLPEFDSEDFIQKGEEFEGYLFPDTYYFSPNIKSEGVIETMKENFNERISSVQDDITSSGYTTHEIITMASLLEEEGVTFQDRKMISGVLWNRIKIGMALQVDAVFPYIIGKNTYQVDLEDLKNESPYNTYTHRGLPPGPITNPGLESIVAALEPIEHNYLYYLSDRQNNTYYAEDFEGHKQNRILYLNK